MTSPADALVLAGAGVLAGMVGTAGGITSLVSYPALLAVGVPALRADVANMVALVACWPGAALGSRPELAGSGPRLRRWCLLTALGGAIGAVALLVTPGHLFARVVPALVAAGSLALLLQPRLSAWRAGRVADPSRSRGLPFGLVAISVYNGYFGAGAGVMTLALVLVTAEPHLPTANALKNMLVGAASVASAATLVAFAPVDWTAVAPLAAGLFAGSVLGPRVTRWAPSGVLRWLVGASGLALAVRLALVPG